MTPSPPSVAICLQLMEEYSMLSNIRDHSFVVARVAERIHSLLSQQLKASKPPPLSLVISGALLHDIAKTKCLDRQCDHARVGEEICLQQGYLEVAEIVGEHVRLKKYVPERYQRGEFLAKEIVFYADKRVLHDQIVSLDERLVYILERYGNNDSSRHEIIRYNFEACRELESWLCKHVRRSPENLLQDLDHTVFKP